MYIVSKALQLVRAHIFPSYLPALNKTTGWPRKEAEIAIDVALKETERIKKEAEITIAKKEAEISITGANKEIEDAFKIDRLGWKHEIAVLESKLLYQQHRMEEKQT